MGEEWPRCGRRGSVEGADPEEGAFDSAVVVCVANLVVITAQSNAGGARLLGNGLADGSHPCRNDGQG